jgi:hypothetical protein
MYFKTNIHYNLSRNMVLNYSNQGDLRPRLVELGLICVAAS